MVQRNKKVTKEDIDLFRDGTVILYKIKGRKKLNPNWQAKIKLPRFPRIVKSLGTADLKLAKEQATELYKNAQIKAINNQPIKSISWKVACERYKSKLIQMNKARQFSDTNLKNTTLQINAHIINAFGNKMVDKITNNDIINFQANVKTGGGHLSGKKPKASTVNKHNTTLRGIFELCEEQGYIQTTPKIKNTSERINRPSLDRGEVKIIQKMLDKYIESNRQNLPTNEINLVYNHMLKMQVMLMIYGGFRPGVEIASITWDKIQYKKNYIQINVLTAKQKDGNTKRRMVFCMPQLKEHLEEFKKIMKPKTKKEALIKHPENVTVHKHLANKPIKSLRNQWQRFLDFAKIKHKPLYSLRHYYFESRLKWGNQSLNALAKNGGTSTRVISDWYDDTVSEDYAESLTSMRK